MHRLSKVAFFGLTGLQAIAACDGGSSEPAVTLEGPTEVRVDKLGPVDGPRVLLGDGSEVPGVIWTVSDPSVAEIRDGEVVAVAPGMTEVTGHVGNDSVRWALSVDPTVTLGFVDPPASVPVGAEVGLVLEARAGESVVPAGAVDWATSDSTVLSVAEGRAKGIKVGVAFVSARRGNSEAMAQIAVIAP